MTEFNNITLENVKLYAAGHYDNPSCSSFLEFEDDYIRIKYLKSLINKYLLNKKVNIRIILNHIICLSNVFPGEPLAKILFTEFDKSTWGVLSTLLLFLNLLPNHSLSFINGEIVRFNTINIDSNLLEKLREL